MEISYTIAGADGQTYGPVTLEQIKTWIQEGRITPQTNVLRSDVNAWHQASQYQELAFGPQPALIPVTPGGSAPLPATPRPLAAQAANLNSPELLLLEKKVKNGANWFYWIAALSMINSVTTVLGSSWGFFLGLGVTMFVSAFGTGAGGIGKIIGVVISGLVCAMFVAFGIFAGKRHAWAFITGMVLYALDGLIFLLFGEWLCLGFHVLALFGIFAGLKASFAYKKMVGAA